MKQNKFFLLGLLLLSVPLYGQYGNLPSSETYSGARLPSSVTRETSATVQVGSLRDGEWDTGTDPGSPAGDGHYLLLSMAVLAFGFSVYRRTLQTQ